MTFDKVFLKFSGISFLLFFVCKDKRDILRSSKESFHHNKCLKAFISLNSNLSSLEILTQYAERCSIELFFKNCKGNLGLNRYLLLMLINYTYCSLSSKGTNHFNIGVKLMKNDLKKSKIMSIYNSVKNRLRLLYITL